jgi:hypothetical protein
MVEILGGNFISHEGITRPMSETTHIQTEITDTTYEEFRALARERGLSLKAALREATEDWIEQQQQIDPTTHSLHSLSMLPPNQCPTLPGRTQAQKTISL